MRGCWSNRVLAFPSFQAMFGEGSLIALLCQPVSIDLVICESFNSILFRERMTGNKKCQFDHMWQLFYPEILSTFPSHVSWSND